jgi:hypothetical protein
MSEILDGKNIVEARSPRRKRAVYRQAVFLHPGRSAQNPRSLCGDSDWRLHPKHTLALELARLDELQQVFGTRALESDVGRAGLYATT